MPFTLIREYQIEAAHRLPRLPSDHKCSRLHGHSYKIEIVVEGEIDEQYGWVIDYQVMDDAFEPIFKTLDHHFLNEIEGLDNPTSENLCRWVYDKMKPTLPLLSEVRAAETCLESCIYRP